jgi:hypothetical protein
MENTFNFKNNSIIYGVLFGIYSSLLLYFGYKFEFEASPLNRVISFSLAILIIYFAINQFKLNNNNLLKISDAIKVGLGVGLIGGLIYGIYTYLHFSFIDEESLLELVDTIKSSEDYQGREMTTEQIKEQKENAISYLSSPLFYLTLNLIGSLFQAFIIALVIGLIKKK